MDIKNRIKQTREDKSLSTYKLAEIMTNNGFKISQSTISKIENGNKKIDTDTLQAIADALEVPVYELIGETPFKKANANYYKSIGDDGIVDLLKNQGFIEDRFRNLSLNDKDDFINNSLSNIDPLKLALKKYLDDFDNFKKSDLIDFANMVIDYINCIKNDFCSELYEPLYDKYQALLKYTKIQSEQIEKYEEVCTDMLSTLSRISNDKK